MWLASDGELVVNHDASYKLHRIEKTKSTKLGTLKLKNDEPMPTLRQYLVAAQPLGIKLVLELKAHSKAKRETQAVRKIIQMVDELGLADRMEYITFSLHAAKEFVRMASTGAPVFYLNGELSPRELKELGFAGPDYHQSVLRKNQPWINQSQTLGMKVNVWTVNKEEDMEWFIGQGVDFITTDEPLKLLNLLKR